jgi:hypothetical protein
MYSRAQRGWGCKPFQNHLQPTVQLQSILEDLALMQLKQEIGKFKSSSEPHSGCALFADCDDQSILFERTSLPIS